MKKNICLRVFFETFPILIGIVLSYFFWKNNILLMIIYIVLIAIVLKIKFYPGDALALIYGFFIGLLVEIIGTSVSGYQSFTNPSFWGIPVWLPIAWAYGLMMMKRIGMIIYEARQ
jgi:hypothetical protein